MQQTRAKRPRRFLRLQTTLVVALLASWSLARTLSAQTAQTSEADDLSDVSVPAIPTPFSEETHVVAIDRLVSLEGTAMGWLRGGKLPKKLDLADFSEGSIGLTPVALEKVVRGLPERAEPWNVVVLLDASLASTRTVRWAVGKLADRSEVLTSLGQVTILLTSGDGEPRTLLLPTEEPEKVKELLSRLALLTEGEDSVMQRRWDWVESGEDESAASRMAYEETLALRRALDSRLLMLRDQGRAMGARRVLLWVTDGFDLSPSSFYGVEPEDPDALASHFRDVARALSADGWIVVALRPPDQDPYRGKARGVRIGKWRFVGIPPFLIWGTREEERDPEKAEALLELGDARLAGDDAEGAAESYGLAYHHFYGDPKTSDRQAVALLRLSDCLEILGDRAGARKARGLASELDPEAAARHLAETDDDTRPDVARMIDPLEPLRLLAEATSGSLVANESELDERLYDLERRLRLTLQLPPNLGPGLHRIQVRWQAEEARAPVWIRVGEAPAASEAEARRGQSGD